MLGVEDYGSDNDSDSETQSTPLSSPQKPSLAAKLPLPSKKSSLSLPPPSGSSGSAVKASTSLPLPKAKKIKKITIGLPELRPEDENFDDTDSTPPAKKPRLESGARSSGLLSMLPTPKNKAPVQAASERVLGSGRGPGLVFNTGLGRSARTIPTQDVQHAEDRAQSGDTDTMQSTEEQDTDAKASFPFLPLSLAKGRVNVSVEEKNERPRAARPAPSSTPSVDFFSIGSTGAKPSSSSFATLNLPTASSAPPVRSSVSPPKLHLLPDVSSAPKVDEFVPPEPTQQDPYPGYYLLPSGAWAAYDPEYYRSFYDRWKRDYDAHVRALEKGVTKGFENLETEGAQEVSALREMEKAKKEIQEREERKALTTGDAEEAAAPKMNIKGAALGGRARTRHQLSTLLTEAYQNREALEERIAQGRRNRKEAGNKYGF